MKTKHKNLSKHKGFTLIELMVVIAILGLLATIVLIAFDSARASARDVQRIAAMDAFEKGLAIYHNRHGKYPQVIANLGTPSWYLGFDYDLSSGSCNFTGPGPELKFDNSISAGFIRVLEEEGIMGVAEWDDPLTPKCTGVRPNRDCTAFNCRYVVDFADNLANNVQAYVLHCNLEVNKGLEKNDGGLSDHIYEVQMPKPWLCITHPDDD